jgi:hypothetical protein
MVRLRWEFIHSVPNTIRNYSHPTSFEAQLQTTLAAFERSDLVQAEKLYSAMEQQIQIHATLTAEHSVCAFFLGGMIAEACHQHTTALDRFINSKKFLDLSGDPLSIARAIEVNSRLARAANNVGYYVISSDCSQYITQQERNTLGKWRDEVQYGADSFLANTHMQIAEQMFGKGYFRGAHAQLERTYAQINDWAMRHLHAIDPLNKDAMINRLLGAAHALAIPSLIPLAALELGDLNQAAERDQALCNWIGIHIFARWHQFRNYYWHIRSEKTPFDVTIWQTLLPELDDAVADMRAYMPHSETAARFALFRVEFMLLPCEFLPSPQWQTYIVGAERSMQNAKKATQDVIGTDLVERGDLKFLCQ